MTTAVGIAEAAARAGWRGQDLITAIAVALAESSGNTNAHNTRGGADARGIWQVNIAAGAHPEYANVDLYDVDTCAKAAFAIWQKDGWGPWVVHNTGAYLLFWPTAASVAGVASVKKIATDPAGAAAGLASSAADAAAALPAADMLGAVQAGVGQLVKAGAWMSERRNWLRVAQVVAGGYLVVGGVLILTRQTWVPAAKTAVKTGGKAAATAAVL